MFILSSDIFSHLLLSSIYLTSTSVPFSLSGHPSSSFIFIFEFVVFGCRVGFCDSFCFLFISVFLFLLMYCRCFFSSIFRVFEECFVFFSHSFYSYKAGCFFVFPDSTLFSSQFFMGHDSRALAVALVSVISCVLVALSAGFCFFLRQILERYFSLTFKWIWLDSGGKKTKKTIGEKDEPTGGWGAVLFPRNTWWGIAGDYEVEYIIIYLQERSGWWTLGEMPLFFSEAK